MNHFKIEGIVLNHIKWNFSMIILTKYSFNSFLSKVVYMLLQCKLSIPSRIFLCLLKKRFSKWLKEIKELVCLNIWNPTTRVATLQFIFQIFSITYFEK